MALTLQDLIKGKDANTIKAELITLLAAYGFDATDWSSGSESRTMIEVEADVLADLYTTVTEIAKGMHLDTATEGWLTLLAKSQYGLDRLPAEYTRGLATFSLIAGGGPRTINAGEIIVSDGLGHNFITDNPAPVNLTTLSPQAQIEIISLTTGYANNVAQGAINVVNQGPADITVSNSGILTPATIFNNGVPTSFTVNTLDLIYQVTVDGVTTAPITLTFAANYANIAALVVALNGNATFASMLTASNDGNVLIIRTNKAGPTQAVQVNMFGSANTALGFPFGANTLAIGGTTIDAPAVILGATLAGPFNISGKELRFRTIVDGIDSGITQLVIFPANYATIQDVVAYFDGSPFNKTSVDAGRFRMETLKKGPKQGIIIESTGTANLDFGFSQTQDTVAVGTSAWITQEGRDEETDDSLRARCKARWGILGAGTRDAFTTWAREADPKVQKVVVYSNYLNGTPKAGAVTVYISGINSALDNFTVAIVNNYINARLPIMSDLYVGTVTIVPVYYSGVLTITSAVNTPQFINGYKNNVNAYSQSLQIGEAVSKQRIEAEIISALRPGFISLNLTEPIPPITTIDKNQLCVVLEDPANPVQYIIK